MHIKNITFIDTKNTVIKSCSIKSLPITEESIIRKSIEFFHDPEPCFIHRGAVISRMLLEMDEYLYSISKQGLNEIDWLTFPEKFKEVLEKFDEVGSIQFI